MGIFVTPEWWDQHPKPHQEQTWFGEVMFSVPDKEEVRAIAESCTESHKVVVVTDRKPRPGGLISVVWSYHAVGADRHDVVKVLEKKFQITKLHSEIAPGIVYVTPRGRAVPESW